jgi:hypothetical protein
MSCQLLGGLLAPVLRHRHPCDSACVRLHGVGFPCLGMNAFAHGLGGFAAGNVVPDCAHRPNRAGPRRSISRQIHRWSYSLSRSVSPGLLSDFSTICDLAKRLNAALDAEPKRSVAGLKFWTAVFAAKEPLGRAPSWITGRP